MAGLQQDPKTIALLWPAGMYGSLSLLYGQPAKRFHARPPATAFFVQLATCRA